MIQFLLSIAALLAIVMVVLLRPLVRRPHLLPAQTTAEEEAPALKILREQKADLDAEHLAGRVTAEEYARTLGELEQRALEESTRSEQKSLHTRGAKAWVWSLAFVLPATALLLYVVLGNLPALDPERRIASAAPHIGAEQINAMVDKLAQHVRDNPEDFVAAQRLGQAYMVLNRFGEAVQVFSQLAAKQPQDAQNYANWADALASAQGQKLDGEPAKLVEKALQLDAKNMKALALAGTLAYEKSDFKKAVDYWTQIVGMVPAESEMGQSLNAMLADARRRAGMPPAEKHSAQTASPLSLKGKLSLGESVKAKAAPDDAVFIFARPVAGGPPLAGMRFKVSDLPVDFDFTKATTMMAPGAPPDKVIVGARVSKSGNAIARSGDLEGFSAAVSPQTDKLNLVIDKVVP